VVIATLNVKGYNNQVDVWFVSIDGSKDVAPVLIALYASRVSRGELKDYIKREGYAADIRRQVLNLVITNESQIHVRKSPIWE